MAFDRPKEFLKPIKTRWIVLSFLVAIAVELLPLDMALASWVPDLTALLVLYWTLNQPRRFGIGWKHRRCGSNDTDDQRGGMEHLF